MKYRTLVFVILLVSLALSACAPLDPVQDPVQGKDPSSEGGVVTLPQEEITPTPEVFIPLPNDQRAFAAARDLLASQLGVDPLAIRLVSAEPVEWQDGCLGLGGPDEICLQAITPGYRLILDVEGKQFEARTNQDGSQVRFNTMLEGQPIDEEVLDVPETCQAEGLKTFADYINAYCFVYPARFEQDERGLAAVSGPNVGSAIEPVFARLDVFAAPAAHDAALETLVANFIKQFEGPNTPQVNRTSLTLGGQPAEMLEPIPGQLSSRIVFALHNGIFYQLIFWPVDEDTVKADFDELYQVVSESFTYIP